MAKMVRLRVCYCIALLFFCSTSNASHPLSPLKCNTPRKKYGLTFKNNSLVLIDRLIERKMSYPIDKKVLAYPFEKKIRTDFYTYTLFLKTIDSEGFELSGHITVSTILNDRLVSFFFPLSCLNKSYLRGRIFISQIK